METQVEQLKEVEKRLKHEKSRRMYERYQTIRLYLQGTSRKEIARILGRSERTIITYIQCYQEQGIEGMDMKFSPGPPERLGKEQQAKLKQMIMDFQPHEVGFTAKFNWTLQLIRDYIKREYDKNYSIRGISKMMHRLGLTYTKPTYTLAAADKEKQKVFVETTFPEIKKLRKRRN